MTSKTTTTCDGCGAVNHEHGYVTMYGLDIDSFLHACYSCWKRAYAALEKHSVSPDQDAIADAVAEKTRTLADRLSATLEHNAELEDALARKGKAPYEATRRELEDLKRNVADGQHVYDDLRKQLNDRRLANEVYLRDVILELVGLMGHKRRQKRNAELNEIMAQAGIPLEVIHEALS